MVTVYNQATKEQTQLTCWVEEYAGTAYDVIRTGTHDNLKSDFVQTVGDGNLVIVSDHRLKHYDSRDFGQVPAASCHRIGFRLWSVEGWKDSEHRMQFL